MSRIICPIHYRQMTIEICYHIQKNFIHQSTVSLNWIKEVRIRYNDLDPELNEPIDYAVHYFCNDCIEQYKLPTDKPIQFMERIEQYSDAFHKKMSIVCVKCFNEYLLKNNR
ncbi:hypothetical protein [Candidatus Albibeggiatoa sp. nov. BB20]|uniref:hypothetical protein n=1 Tax=Candidatus Albibeggiatoa sp. nov. BB20 TaxID=3162723 RepID=UPI0033654229